MAQCFAMRRSAIRTSFAFLLLTGFASLASAQLTVTQNLGTLGAGSTNIVGTTAGAPNEVDGLVGVTNTGPGAFGYYGGNRVYQFTTTVPLLYTGTLNSVGETSPGLESDPDFFLLDSLVVDTGTSGDRFSQTAITFDFLQPNTSGPAYPVVGDQAYVAPGTYYMTVGSWIGTEGDPNLAGAFNFTMDFDAVVTPTPLANWGVISAAFAPLSIDSFGSDFDTQLALFNADGELIIESDDAPGNAPFSQLSRPAGLVEGTYYVAMAGYETIFGGLGWLADASGNVEEFGAYGIHYPTPGGPATQSGTLAVGEVQWYTFSIGPGVPTPPTVEQDLGQLALAGEALSFTTEGSLNNAAEPEALDTEIGIYNSNGELVVTNDDVDDGVIRYSLIELMDGLDAGDYYLAVSGWESIFDEQGYLVESTSDEEGSLLLTYTGGTPITGTLGAGEVFWYSFSIGESSVLLGDANNDGVVDVFDFDAISQNFGSSGLPSGGTGLGDANDDGVVDVFDFDAVSQNFGNTLAGSLGEGVVPEPSTIALLGLGAVALGATLRKRR